MSRLTLPLLLLTACSPEDTTTRDALLQHLAVDHALGRYEAFRSQADALSQATASLCEAPTADALAAARDAWWATRTPWKQAELIQFGPVIEYPERLGPKIDDWPVNIDPVEELIAGEGALDQAAFDAMGTATRGFAVLEYLLWDEGDDTLTALTDDARRCDVAAGVAADLATNAGRLVSAWQTDWIDVLTVPTDPDDATYPTPQAVLDEWVNRMVFTTENIRAEKLGKPIGDDAGGEPQPDTLESPFSDRSLTDALDALDGVRRVFQGEADPSHGVAILLAEDPDLVARVDQLLATSHDRLAEVPEPLSTTILVEPETVARAQEALQALQVVLQVDVAQALGVTIAFNDNDGD